MGEEENSSRRGEFFYNDDIWIERERLVLEKQHQPCSV
jgi:hypothetical protein